MEKNRIHPVKVGKGVRMSFARQKEVLEMPNLIEVQTRRSTTLINAESVMLLMLHHLRCASDFTTRRRRKSKSTRFSWVIFRL